MSAPTEFELDIICITLVVLFYALYGFRQHWNFPLRRGPDYFFGVQVPPGFYQGSGTRWLKSYHILVIALFGVVAMALAAIVFAGRWDVLPLWFGGTAILITTAVMIFVGWTRHKLGASPPVLPGVAAPLEARRLGDYISWPVEALVAGVVAASWLLLLFRGDAGVDWRNPVTTSWVVLGLLPGKILLIRNSFPLPPEHAEEHYRLSEASRRWSLRYMDAFRWVVVAPLAFYALKHSWATAQEYGWLSWAFVAIFIGLFLWLVYVLIDQRRLTAMSRGLRPAGSWSTPFRPARLLLRGGLTWFGIWFGGLILLLVFFRG